RRIARPAPTPGACRKGGRQMDAAWRRELVDLLASLRRSRRQQSGLDAALVPPDTATAYEIAGEVARALGWPVAGWKIAATKEEMQQALRTDAPIYGRVFMGRVMSSPAEVVFADQCSPIPEAEYIVRLGTDLPPRDAPYAEAEVADAVASIHPGLELAECRFIHDDAFPPLPAILADGAGGGTLVMGPAIPNWRDGDISGQEVRLFCDGELRRRGWAGEALDHPLRPLTWLANELSRTGIGLMAGQVISTGTTTGMLRPKAGQTYDADFGPFGRVTARYT
ncbi:MAG: fumarylacetoacetate hydrolase family protein, partial [Pseudomonadota bacterium]